MNTGFATPQLAAVSNRENARVVLLESEFLGLLDAMPHGIPRIVTRVNEKDEVDPRDPDNRRVHSRPVDE